MPCHPRFRRLLWPAVLALAPALSPTPAGAQARGTPQMDGQLDDAVWRAAPVLAGFAQARPNEGAAPSAPIALQFAQDGQYLYVALRVRLPAGEAVRARNLKREGYGIQSDDHATLVLDPRGTAANGFYLRVNALGAQADGLIFDGKKSDVAWDAPWDAYTAQDEGGWQAELAIPLSALGAPPATAAWHVNAEVYTAHHGERSRLFGAVNDREVTDLALAQPLNGLAPQIDGLGLRLRPSLRVVAEAHEGGASRRELQPALDAIYMLRPGVTATLTLNTDFSDANADDRIVKLSRFELFRPEKRAFFTQDAGRFEFGGLRGGDAPLLPFFSRRVALGRTLDAGVKLSGSIGALEFGALAAQVEAGEGEPTPRLAVVRLAGEVAAGHRLGGIATTGRPDGQGGSTLAGVDYQWQGSEPFFDGELQAFAWALSTRDREAGQGQAYGASIARSGEGPIAALSAFHVGDAFAPALGFVQETGVQSANADLGWNWYLPSGSHLTAELNLHRRLRLDGLEHSSFVGVSTEYASAQGDVGGAECGIERERIAQAFDVLPGVNVPAGDHRWPFCRAFVYLSGGRWYSFDAELSEGGYYAGGKSREAMLAFFWRPTAHWYAKLLARRHHVEVAAQAFTVQVRTAELSYAANPRSVHTVVWGHDNVSQQSSLGLRSRWTFARNWDFAFSLDRQWPVPLGALKWRGVAKVMYTWEG